LNCKHCNKPVYVARICPYCKENYCIEHYEPTKHFCMSRVKLHQKANTLTEKLFSRMHTLQRTFFFTAFLMVVFEDVLRKIGWLKFASCFELNLYVAILSQFFSPCAASFVAVLAACLTLLATRKFSKVRNSDNNFIRFLKFSFSLGVYTTILAAFAFSVSKWLFMFL